MLLVPLGGAAENVSVVPDTEYVDGSCTTPVTATRIDDVFAGATVIVKAVVEPSPLNVSVRKATEIGGVAYVTHAVYVPEAVNLMMVFEPLVVIVGEPVVVPE